MSHRGISLGQNAMNAYLFSAVAGQTAYSGLDLNGLPLGGLVAGKNIVVVDGQTLIENRDYVVSADGGAITLQFQPIAGALISIIAFGAFSVANALAQAQADALYHRRRNRLFNPCHQISQFNGANVIPIATGTEAYIDDGWIIAHVSGATITGQVVAQTTPSGASKRLRLNVAAADASITAAKYCHVRQRIEGQLIDDLLFGRAGASAKTILLRVGLNAHVAGIYGLCLATPNGGGRAYIGLMTIAPGEVGTDVVRYVRLSPDATGSWSTDNSLGAVFRIAFAAGSNYQGVANVWQANLLSTSAQANALGATGHFDIFDCALYDVTGMGPSAIPTFEVPQFDDELRKCQRYYQKTHPYDVLPGTAVGAGSCSMLFGALPSAAPWLLTSGLWPTPMRTPPAMTTYDGAGAANRIDYWITSWNSGGACNVYGRERAFVVQANNIAGGTTYGFDIVGDARL